MKNILNKSRYALAGLALACCASCSLLEPKAEDVIFQEDYFKTYHDGNAALWGVYSGLQAWVEPMFVLGEMRADQVEAGPGATADLLELAEHRVTATNRYTDWSPYYDVINRANYLLENLDKIEKSPFFTQAHEDQYRGEMYFLKSMAYFRLVQDFGDVPMVPQAITHVNANTAYPAVSQEVVLDSIEASLNKAALLVTPAITELNSSLATVTHASLTRMRGVVASVNALRTEVYLYRNKYAEANEAAQLVYNNSGSYALSNNFSNGNWFNLFKNKFQNLESIMEVAFTYASRETNSLQRLTSADAGGQAMVLPSLVAVNRFRTGNTPTAAIKRDRFRGYGASYDSTASHYLIYKYTGLDRITSPGAEVARRKPYESDANWYLYRFSDVQLMRAEALNRLGNKSQALTYLNAVRSRVSLAAVPLTAAASTEAIEDAILQERALELAFEGKRWYDLLRIARRGRPEVLRAAVLSRVPAEKKAAVAAALANPDRWYLPYNARELQLNPALKAKP
ncbi:MAG: RagB/SusD family nutrient uptake outer membrane protein [Adhaeribacter sp.]